MSHITRKPVYAICKQQRRRSACASVQSDQHLCSHCLDSIIYLVSIPNISSLYLASVTAQAGLSITWSQTPKTGFLVTWLKWDGTWQNLRKDVTTKTWISLHIIHSVWSAFALSMEHWVLGYHVIHVIPPGSSRSLLEMEPDSRTPASETESPGCENKIKKIL